MHDVLKNELAAGVMPSKYFGANAAWLRLAAITDNVLTALKRLALPADGVTTGGNRGEADQLVGGGGAVSNPGADREGPSLSTEFQTTFRRKAGGSVPENGKLRPSGGEKQDPNRSRPGQRSRIASAYPADCLLWGSVTPLGQGADRYRAIRGKTDYNFSVPKAAWDANSNKAHWRNRPSGKPFFPVFNLVMTHES